MGERKLALFFEDIAALGNGANHVSIKPWLRNTSPKTLFFSEGFYINACARLECEQKRILHLMFHAAEIFLHFQPDFSPDVHYTEKYLGGVEYQTKIRQSLHSTTEKWPIM